MDLRELKRRINALPLTDRYGQLKPGAEIKAEVLALLAAMERGERAQPVLALEE